MKTILFVAVLATLLSACATGSPSRGHVPPLSGELPATLGPLSIQREAPFAANINVSQAVLAECGLTRSIPDYVRKYVASHRRNYGYDQVVMPDDVSQDADGQQLKITIVGLTGDMAGGGWTGNKSIIVQGTLFEKGQIIGTFVASDHWSPSIFLVQKQVWDLWHSQLRRQEDRRRC